MLEPGGLCSVCIFEDALGFAEAPPEPPAPPVAPPARMGDYELIEEIARGGMGVVWRARQRRLNREVALKFVLPGALPGEVVARRFRQEAEVAARLSHPHIVTIYEVGEADGRYFLCMELAEGGSLAQRLQQGPSAPRAAAELAVKLARTVQHAHDRGVLHRDLKPGNVLFDRAGEPRVTDFGLAQLVNARSDLTFAGAPLGTPSYMSPEQAGGKNENLTTASDVYGLGAILYEMLAGRPPFIGEAPVDVLRRVIDEEPPRLTGIDRDLETICLTCLAKQPEARYRSALALAEELERWLTGRPIRARRVSAFERMAKWMRRHPLLTALWLALVAAVIVTGGVIMASRVRVAAARGAAEASAIESLHRRADQHTTAAILAIERGDSLRALPSLAEAIRIGTGDPTRDRINRIRFETTLQLAPKLEKMWFPSWVVDAQMDVGQQRLVVCDSKDVLLYDLGTSEAVVPPMVHGDYLLHAVLHPSLQRVISGTMSGDFYVWNSSNGTRLAKVEGHFLKSPRPFADGASHLALWGGNQAMRFSVETTKFDGAKLSHPANVEWAWLCAGDHRIITCAADQLLRVWDPESGELIGTPLPCGQKTHLLGEKPGAQEVLVQTGQEPPWLLDVEHGARKSSLVVSGDLRAAGWLNGRPLLVTSTRDGFALTGGDNGEILLTAMHDSHGNDAVFSSDGLRLLARAVQGNSRVWDVDNTRALTPFLWEGADPAICDMDAHGQHLLLSSRESAIRLWRVEDRWGAIAEVPLPPGDQLLDRVRDQVPAAASEPPAFHRDSVAGRPVLDAPKPWFLDLHVLDPASGRDLFPPLRHQARVIDAVLSPDGRTLASYATNQCAYLWDARTGEPIGPLLRHSREIESIAFSPDGALLLTTARTVLQVWEVTTGTLATPPMPHPYPIRRAWWNPEGTAIFTVDLKGIQREWKTAPGQRSVEDLQTLGRLYSSHRVTTGAALHPLGLEDLRSAWEAAKKIQHP